MTDFQAIQSKAQAQFGPTAHAYLTSIVHAHGPGLQRLIDLTQPQPHWHVLDVATGGGHTAFAFSPHVAHVVASDITSQMLQTAQTEAQQRHLTNLSFEYAEATQLPFGAETFDLITCRVAAHHFPDIFRFLQSAHHVLKSNCLIAIEDNTVPDGLGGDYINAFETLRDPSHVGCLSAETWIQSLYAAGFEPLHSESSLMLIPDFEDWANRMRVSPQNNLRLRAMLLQAPLSAATILTPQTDGNKITFHLEKTILIGKKIER